MGFKILDYNNIVDTIKKIFNEELNQLYFLELGEQEFKITFDEAKKCINLIQKFISSNNRVYKKNKNRYSFYAKDFLKLVFKKVDSIDIKCNCKNTFKINLGKNLKDQNFFRNYDIINNQGTTEHVGQFKINYETSNYNPQYEVFKNIHNLIKVNGLVFNSVPYLGMNHGAYNYDLIFFSDLAKYNNYKIIYNYKKIRGNIMHTYCCFQKINNNNFINLNTFNKIRGLEKKNKYIF